jgi:hypothetical protein
MTPTAQQTRRLEFLFTEFLELASNSDRIMMEREFETWHASLNGEKEKPGDRWPDPLRVRELTKMKEPEQMAAFGRCLVDRITAVIFDQIQFEELHDLIVLQQIAQSIDLITKNRGCETAAEELVSRLIGDHYCRPLTPEDVARAVEDFKDSFESSLEAARYFARLYPELLVKRAAQTEQEAGRR